MTRTLLLLLTIACLILPACRKPIEQVPDYSKPLPPGTFGLRRITDPSRLPDLTPAVAQMNDPSFRDALQRSLNWYAIPSTSQFFPSGPISHPHAWTSVYAMRAIADESASQSDALMMLREEFDVWESVGWDGSGEVLYTGYFTPTFEASKTPGGRFRYPLYRRPADLVADPVTGEVAGRRTSAGVVPYPTRQEIETSGMMRGLELVYLPSRLDAYIIEVNGSAKLNLQDSSGNRGETMYVGFAGTNGRDYTSIRARMVEDGLIDENESGLPAIRAYFRRHPEQLETYIRQNDRFVFFQEYDSTHWPAGSLGVKVTPLRSLATDKAIFPRGSVVMTETTLPTPMGGTRSFNQLMLDQDTGGAIRAAGRADIYIGIGDEAEHLAGRQAAQGRLYYLLLKPHRVQAWYDRMRQER